MLRHNMNLSLPRFGILSKIRRSPKLEGWAFANFGSSSGIEEEPSQKRGKKVNAVTTGNQTRDLSITDQMSALTNQVHLKIQFRHRFDQKCPFTDSFHRLASRFARTLSVPLEKIFNLFTLSQIHCVEFGKDFIHYTCYIRFSVITWVKRLRDFPLGCFV